MGLMPVLWGMLFDWLEQAVGGGAALASRWSWNRYALIYGVVVAGIMGSTFLRRRIQEPKAVSTEEFMRMVFFQMPARIVARALMPLFRFPPQG
jgi:cytochrome c oxidase subunit IV